MFATILRAARPPFLLLTPACVLPAWALVLTAGVNPAGSQLIAVLIAALAAHMSVNLFNEYTDFRSGIDLHTRRTPFSGGSGALPTNPSAAAAVRATGVAMLALAVTIGLGFVWLRGWPLLLVGLGGTALVVFYSGAVNRHPLLCLIAPGLGFGLCVLLGAEIALGGVPGVASAIITTITGLLVSNLLLLNQLPDVDADRAGGRRHLPAARGPIAAARVYTGLAAMACMLLVVALVAGLLPSWCALALLPFPAAAVAAGGAFRHGTKLGRSPGYLAANVAVANLTPLLLGLGLLLSIR